MNIRWEVKKFDELTVHELYALLRLRSEVFVVEQNCVFLDMDNNDQDCWHLLGWHDNQLVASTRLVPTGHVYNNMCSIGRVVTSGAYRRTGIGRILMERSIEETWRLFGVQPIKIGAQLYLKDFYSSLGFEQSGDIYIEDGIDHIEMILPGPAS